jgi:hypothetical protein
VGEGVSNVTISYLLANTTLSTLTSTGGTNVTLSGSRIPPLTVINATTDQLNYTFLYEFSNGTNYNKTSPANYWQTILWAYYQNITVNPTAYTPGNIIYTFTNLTNVSSAADVLIQYYWNSTPRNGTYLNSSTYYTTYTAPAVSDYSWDYMNSTLNITFAGTSLNRTSAQFLNVSVWQVGLVACPGAVAINFTFWGESNFTALFSDMELTLWGYPLGNPDLNESGNFTFTNVKSAAICLTPAWATFYVDSWQIYRSPSTYYTSGSYPQRAYFLDGALVNNVSNNVSLYLENATLTKLIEITLLDTNGQGVPDANLYFNRYYPGEDLYRTVAMVKTDDYGLGNTYLIPNDVWFRIVAVKDGTTLRTFTPQTIPCDPGLSACPLSLSLAPDSYVEFTDYWDQFAYGCSFNATGTNATVCSFTDSSGLMKYARLKVWRIGIFSPSLLCDNNVTTASGSLTCNLGDATGSYSWEFSAHFQDENIFQTGVIELTSANLFEGSGIFVTIILFMVMAGVGAFNPIFSVALGFIALAFALAIGAYDVGIGALVGLGVVVLIFAAKAGR